MVYVFLADGFEDIEALCPVDILRRAGANVSLVSINKSRTVTSRSGLIVTADVCASELVSDPNPEMVVLPGGMPGASNLDANRIVHEFIQKTAEKGGYLAAICAAPMILGRMGLLKGRRAVCYPGFERQLAGAVLCPDEYVVRDGNIITGRAMGSALRFSLALVEALFGVEKAAEVGESVLA